MISRTSAKPTNCLNSKRAALGQSTWVLRSRSVIVLSSYSKTFSVNGLIWAILSLKDYCPCNSDILRCCLSQNYRSSSFVKMYAGLKVELVVSCSSSSVVILNRNPLFAGLNKLAFFGIESKAVDSLGFSFSFLVNRQSWCSVSGIFRKPASNSKSS